MPAINKRIPGCILAALLAQSVLTPLAMADSFMTELDRKPQLMLYASKSFGEKSDLKKAPQFGLRLQRNVEKSPLAFTRGPVLAKTVSVADLRWTRGFGQSMHLMGVPLYRSPLQLNSVEGSSSEGSASGESMGPYGTVIIWSVAALAVLCATNTILCEDDEYQSPVVEDPPTDG